MISIDLGEIEYYDPTDNVFYTEECGIVDFEFSLKAIYDWEHKYKKSFLKGNLSPEESIDFYCMMALRPIEPKFLTGNVITTLKDYISDSGTATIFSSSQNGNKTASKGKIYTAEEIYAIMFMNNIDLEFENRNFNRLMTIIRVIDVYNSPKKKMSKQDIMKQNAELNRQRKAMLNTRG